LCDEDLSHEIEVANVQLFPQPGIALISLLLRF
jgi:hypothetical protein